MPGNVYTLGGMRSDDEGGGGNPPDHNQERGSGRKPRGPRPPRPPRKPRPEEKRRRKTLETLEPKARTRTPNRPGRSHIIILRVTAGEKALFNAAARYCGMTLSSWIRGTLMNAARRWRKQFRAETSAPPKILAGDYLHDVTMRPPTAGVTKPKVRRSR